MRAKKCKHLKVSFLGMQETMKAGKYLALYNCEKCHSTVSVPVIDVRGNTAGKKPTARVAMAR